LVRGIDVGLLSYNWLMAETSAIEPCAAPQTNRRDHYIPRGYLRGFIAPARMNHQRPLWQFDIPNRVWSQRSPREVGYRYGFYDYAKGTVGLEAADRTFVEMEKTFPKVRDALISSDFENWKEDFLEFLLSSDDAGQVPSVFRSRQGRG